jgi:hypothetical protein
MQQGDFQSGIHEQQQPLGPDFTIFWRARSSAQPHSSSPSMSRVSSGDVFRYRTPELQVDAVLPVWSTRRYIESAARDAATSFVLLFGACHWKGRADSWLTDSDLATVLRSHRERNVPCLLDLDGNFCLLSYDHLSDSIWVAPDFWATVAFYYGQRAGLSVISSRAGAVADAVQSPIDAATYLALARNTVPPVGSTLFRDVSRITLGEAIHLGGSSPGIRTILLAPLYRDPIPMSLRDVIDRTKTVLRSVVPFSASREATAVDFTAGNDTRLVAAALAERPDVAAALSFRVVGQPDSPDVQISGRIARRLGWHHVACPGVTDGLTTELLPSTALAADGSFPLQLIANRLAFEARYATDARHLVVGLNGELFRNWIWQPELFSMGRSTAINYNALLRHRIPRDHGLDALRVSAGLLTSDAHDQLLIERFRRLAAQYPSALNVYKLDLVYIQRLMHRIPWWAVAPRIVTILPFLWAAVTDVSLRIPWFHKRTRRLVTTVVEELHPWVAAEPTDRGAPFKPLRPSTAFAYAKYLSGYTTDIVRRHYLHRTPSPLRVGDLRASTPPPPPLPAEWADWLDPRSATYLHDPQGVVDTVRTGRSHELTRSRREEFLTMLMVELLFRHYSGIRRELALR